MEAMAEEVEAAAAAEFRLLIEQTALLNASRAVPLATASSYSFRFLGPAVLDPRTSSELQWPALRSRLELVYSSRGPIPLSCIEGGLLGVGLAVIALQRLEKVEDAEQLRQIAAWVGRIRRAVTNYRLACDARPVQPPGRRLDPAEIKPVTSPAPASPVLHVQNSPALILPAAAASPTASACSSLLLPIGSPRQDASRVAETPPTPHLSPSPTKVVLRPPIHPPLSPSAVDVPPVPSTSSQPAARPREAIFRKKDPAQRRRVVPDTSNFFFAPQAYDRSSRGDSARLEKLREEKKRARLNGSASIATVSSQAGAGTASQQGGSCSKKPVDERNSEALVESDLSWLDPRHLSDSSLSSVDCRYLSGSSALSKADSRYLSDSDDDAPPPPKRQSRLPSPPRPAPPLPSTRPFISTVAVCPLPVPAIPFPTPTRLFLVLKCPTRAHMGFRSAIRAALREIPLPAAPMELQRPAWSGAPSRLEHLRREGASSRKFHH